MKLQSATAAPRILPKSPLMVSEASLTVTAAPAVVYNLAHFSASAGDEALMVRLMFFPI